MKKILVPILILMFFVISCSSSKKTENNDVDILPDEDVTDADENDEDEEAVEPDEDETETDDSNPCDLIENSDGGYTQISDENFKCGCLEGYFWADPGCKKTTYANICTGQTLCFDNLNADYDCPEPGEDFYGQDAQYAALGYCTKSSFVIDRSVENEKTVKDKNLKIEWTKKAAESEYTWEDAVKYCEDLEFGGHDDWRLPNPKEMLFSTLSRIMQDTDKAFFWSGTSDNQDNTSAWGLYNNGEDITIRTSSKTSSYSVRCVREEAPAEPLFKAFAIAGNTIVRDFDSGLAWTEKPERIRSWKEALAYCENLYYAGTSDWRLPNIHELISLADHKRSNPATSFPYGFAVDLISSTTDPGTVYDKSFKYIAFDTGRNGTSLKEETFGINFYALCVRNEPCKENYWWNGVKCVEDSGCAGNPCKNDEHSNGFCMSVNLTDHACGCVENYFWDGVECVSPCDPNPCENDQKSTGECTAPDINTHECGCVDGHFWNGEKCINPCSGVSCNQFEHGTGECRTDNAFTFRCDCDEGYYWWGGNKGCLNKKPDAVNVCTGQNKCYNTEKEIPCPAEGEEFFGQDAQFARLGYCTPQSYSIDYSVENEPVVVDNNTGMMWQQKIPPIEELYIEEVNGYCNNLVYGGYDDWRLPSVTDFVTITDFGRYYPATDTEYFPQYGSFWTSTNSEVHGSGGDLPHIYYYAYYYSSIFDSTEPLIFNTTTLSYYIYDNNIFPDYYNNYASSYNIRCVRGSDTESSTFTSKTFGKNLIWHYDNDAILVKKTGAKHTWQEALKYCSELDYAGISDWRLPNVRELYLTGNTGVHSSTTKMASLDSDYSETKETTLKETTKNNTLCIANDSCEDGKFWNGEKCAKNPCAGNPCKSDSNSNGTCTVLDEENHLCGCQKGTWNNELKECIVDETPDESPDENPDADTDEIPDEASDADADETPDSDESENGE